MPVLVLFIVLLAGLFAYFFSGLHDVYHEAEEGDLASFYDSFAAEVENQKQLALTLASTVAGNPAVQEALANRDAQSLLSHVLPGYELLKENNDSVILHQFHLTDGTLFLNAGDPTLETPQMALSRTVVLANQQQQPVAGLELESGMLGIRGVIPVFYEGEHVGSVAFVVGLDETLLVSLKEKYGGEWQLLLAKDLFPEGSPVSDSPNPELIVFATTQATSLFNDPESYGRALNGASTITHPSVAGRDYAILSAPVYDHSERIVGVLDIVYDHTHISSVQNRRLLLAGLASLGALFLGALSLVLLTQRTLRPIQALTRAAAEITEGRVSPYVNIAAGNDEIGILVNGFNRMTTQLRSSIVDLEQRVSERTHDLENQALRLRATAEVARDIATAHDLHNLLERSVQLIHERFSYDHVSIFLLDKNREHTVLRASAGEPKFPNQASLRLRDTGIVQQVATTGEPRITLDITPEEGHANTLLMPSTRSEMALPLKAEDVVIGVLDIQSAQAQAFHSEDLAIMGVMADLLATSIERTRLLEEVERSLHELERAHGQYTREVWQSFEGSGRISNQGYRFDNIRLEPVAELPTPASEALATGMVVRSNGSDASSMVAMPIRLRGQTIGVVNMKLKEGFEQSTIATIESSIDRLAAALESARLYEEASLRADREQAISHVTSAISSSTEYEDILRTAVMEIGSMLNDTEVAIQILRDSGDQRASG
jgi:GAF domain-containing protein/HAMP domain-containing protein